MPPYAARFGMPFEDGLECRARRQAIADHTPAIENCRATPHLARVVMTQLGVRQDKLAKNRM
jgi:hypothetical protein